MGHTLISVYGSDSVTKYEIIKFDQSNIRKYFDERMELSFH